MRRRNRMVKLIEYIKVLSLLAILVICTASWFVDPFAPVGSGPRGYLGISFDAGFNLNNLCKPIATKAEECRMKATRGATASKPINDSAEAASFGWVSFLRKVQNIAEQQDNQKQSQYPSECIELTSKTTECRQKARTTKEQIQLRCVPQITAQWECKNSGVSTIQLIIYLCIYSSSTRLLFAN